MNKDLHDDYVDNENQLNDLRKKQIKLKYQLHKLFFRRHKGIFRIADTLLIIAILFNFGAVISTGLIVEKAADTIREYEDPEFKVELYEANPIAASNADLKTSEKVQTAFKLLVINFYVWLIVFMGYIYLRLNVYTMKGLASMFALILFFFVTTGYDFFNDMGYTIGKMLWQDGFISLNMLTGGN